MSDETKSDLPTTTEETSVFSEFQTVNKYLMPEFCLWVAALDLMLSANMD